MAVRAGLTAAVTVGEGNFGIGGDMPSALAAARMAAVYEVFARSVLQVRMLQSDKFNKYRSVDRWLGGWMNGWMDG